MQVRNYSKLAILILFCFALVGMRVVYTETPVYIFLIWNLFLAVVPYILSKIALDLAQQRSVVTTSLLVLFCILFLPNASYIVTDLFHLRTRSAVPIWFDSVMIFTFALTGLILFYRSLENLERISLLFFNRTITIFNIVLVIFASAFGMYLGRYLRFNSWDIVSDPLYLIQEIAQRILYPLEHSQAWGMTIVYGLFLMVIYFLMRPNRVEV